MYVVSDSVFRGPLQFINHIETFNAFLYYRFLEFLMKFQNIAELILTVATTTNRRITEQVFMNATYRFIRLEWVCFNELCMYVL